MLLMFTAVGSYGQPGVAVKMASYMEEHPSCNLYVHADRNVYAPGDTIWFKSYMLSAHKSEVMYVRVVDARRQTLVAKQFPVYDLRSDGWIPLPDTAVAGPYFLYGFTDLMINFSPEDAFVMPLRIVPNTERRVELEAFATNGDAIERGAKTTIGIRARDQKGPLVKASGVYTVWVGDSSVKTGRIKTNEKGAAEVQFTYPRLPDSASVRFEVFLTEAKSPARLLLNLRHEGNQASIRVFPEGGRLVAGVLNNVVFEATDANKNPVTAVLKLLRGNKVLDSVQTDGNGLGRMSFVPLQGVMDSLMVTENNRMRKIALPREPVTSGYMLRVSGNDTVVIFNVGMPGSVELVLRSFNKVLWSRSVQVAAGDSLRLVLPADSMPRGVLSLAVLGAGGIAEAERYFMHDPGKGGASVVNVEIAKVRFGAHHRVKATVTVSDQDHHGIKANLSVAVVAAQTLERGHYPTITQGYYYHHLRKVPGIVLDAKQGGVLDQFLITQSWKGYGWGSIVGYRPSGTLQLLSAPGEVYGKVTAKHRKASKVSDLMILSGGGSGIVPVNGEGRFSIPPEDLFARGNDRKYLVLGRDFRQDHDIELGSHAGLFDEGVRSGSLLHFSMPFSTMAVYRPDTFRIFNNEIRLQEVVVKSGKKWEVPITEQYGGGLDYVCKYLVLNCPMHTQDRSHAPKKGLVYRYENALIIYNGAGQRFTMAPKGSFGGAPPPPPSGFLLPEISSPLPFYNPDYSVDPPVGADIRTTLFWAPNLNTGEEGKTSFDFFTSDISGNYIIVIQGVEMETLNPVCYMYNLEL